MPGTRHSISWGHLLSLAAMLPLHVEAGQDGVLVFYDRMENGELTGGFIVEPEAPRAAAATLPGFACLNPEWDVAQLAGVSSPANRVNIVFLGDGFTQEDMAFYHTLIAQTWAHISSIEPFESYLTYFNAYRVDVISNESGIDQTEPMIDHDTALDGYVSVYHMPEVSHAKLYPAAACAPGVDQIVVMLNTVPPHDGYAVGGFNDTVQIGTTVQMVSTLRPSPNTGGICAHELGHAFAWLGDEYEMAGCRIWTGQGEFSSPNVSIHDAVYLKNSQLKWHLWIDEACAADCYSESPECIGSDVICREDFRCTHETSCAGRERVCGYEGAAFSRYGLFRPTFESIMRNPASPTFGPVNTEQLIIQIYKRVSPINDATPASPRPLAANHPFFVEPMQPIDHALDVQWHIDGEPIPGATATTFAADPAALAPGNHTLSVRVTDHTPRVRDETARQTYLTATREWSIVADCNANGLPDDQDIASGASLDVDGDGLPDECEDCNHNRVPDDHEIPTGASQDLNGNGLPDECEPDCNHNQAPDDYDISTGASQDADRDGLPNECEDCNVNGQPDGEDIEAGAQDLNANQIPDECEPDCNANGAPDDVDIQTGASQDCDSDGLPDECEAGAWSPVGSGAGATITALVSLDDGSGPMLYAGGVFTQIGGLAANRVARWDGEAWEPLGSGVNSTVTCLAAYDDGTGPALYAGGLFTAAGGQPANRIARWDGQAWYPLGDGLNGTVWCLGVYDDGTGPALYAGGYFTLSGSMAVSRLARWNGQAWSAVGGGLDNAVLALTVHDDGTGPALYVGGSFTHAGGRPAHHLARWNGAGWTPLGGGLSVSVKSLCVHDDGSGPALYAAGSLTQAGDAPWERIARWDGQNWSGLGEGIGGGVTALASVAEGPYRGLYAGGSFQSAGGQTAEHIAWWRDQQWHTMNGGTGLVYAIEPYSRPGDSGLYVAGTFTTAGCTPAAMIARWNLHFLRLLDAALRKSTPAGDFDVPLSLDNTIDGCIECRGGSPLRIVLTFDRPVRALDHHLDETEFTLSPGAVTAATADGAEVIVELAGIPGRSWVTLSISGLADPAGHPMAEPLLLGFEVLQADLNADGSIDADDLGLLQSCASGPTVPAPPGCESRDYDADQDVDQSDFGLWQRCFRRTGKVVETDH